MFAVVDTRTGDVLYVAKPSMLKNLAAKPEKTAGGIDQAFEEFARLPPATGK